MPEVIGVKFKTSNKIYFFDPLDQKFSVGEGVVVETARGLEYGTIGSANQIVSDDKIVQPLKPIIRKGTLEDKETALKLEALARDTMKKALPKVAELNPNMKLVDTEYTFDQSKIIFYFTASGREDFRELVKCLAGMFRKRIEMRQIDEREDIKMRGGFGICGRECCCSCYSSNGKVSIKMAKNQNLSLNPTKISGLCGKLMCCLRYENDYYAEMLKVIPKNGVEVITPVGVGKVEGTDILKQEVKVKLENKEGAEIKVYKLQELKTKDGKALMDQNNDVNLAENADDDDNFDEKID